MHMPEEVSRAADQLLDALRNTDAFVQYDELRKTVLADEASCALLRRFQSAQTALQLAALAGREPSEEDTSAFEGLSGLLYANPDTADYLLSQMRMQQLVAQVMQKLTTAAGLEETLPEL